MRRLITIAMMDVVGYSRLMERDEAGTLDRLKSVRASILDPTIARHNGRTVKLMGDGTLAEFASVVEGLQCAVDIQEELVGRNSTLSESHKIQLRIGLHLGDVIVEGDDIYGDGVNVAARLENIAEPGGIVLSKQVHDHIGGNVQVKFTSLGPQTLKNINRPVEAYRVLLEGEAASENVIRFGRGLADSASRPSIAVLPMTNLVGDSSQDYFADGITEDITTALSKNRWLCVVARNSAFSFRNSEDGNRVIGEKLGADYILTGSVRKAGARVRISVQVVEAKTENTVWSERFDRDMVDIFDLQDDITEIVAARIESELGLSEQRKAARNPRKNLGAWDLYQLGTAEFYKFTPESNQRCQEILRQSLEVDEGLACAHSRLAYAIVLSMVYFDATPEPARMDEALAAAKRAIALDDQDATAFFTIGRVHLARQEYEQAIDALEHAVELNPYSAVTYCGLGDSFAYEGRLDEAIEQFDIAIRLCPHDPFRWAFYSYRSLAHLFRGEFEDSVTWARKSVQLPNAQYWAAAHLVSALGHLGNQEQAKTAIKELKRTKPEFSLDFAREHLFYLKRKDQIDLYIAGLEKAGLC